MLYKSEQFANEKLMENYESFSAGRDMQTDRQTRTSSSPQQHRRRVLA